MLLLQNHHGLLSQPSRLRSKVKCVHCNPSRAFFPSSAGEREGDEGERKGQRSPFALLPTSDCTSRPGSILGERDGEGLDIVCERETEVVSRGQDRAERGRQAYTCPVVISFSPWDSSLTVALKVWREWITVTVCGRLWPNQRRIETFMHLCLVSINYVMIWPLKSGSNLLDTREILFHKQGHIWWKEY